MSALAVRLAGLPVRDLRPLADRSDSDLVLAGYTPASVRQFRKALNLGMSERDAEDLLREEGAPAPRRARRETPVLVLPATPAYVLLAMGFTPASIASYRLAVLLGASPTDAEDLLQLTPQEARLAA